MKNKTVLVVGLGMSGISAVKALDKLGAKILAYDMQNKEKMSNVIEELKDINVQYYFDTLNFDTNIIDIAIKSPGIKYETPVIQKLLQNNVKIITDFEAAYLITKSRIVAITGTNGKTTTTTLVGELMKYAHKNYKLTGNIGSGIFYDALSSTEDEVLVAEASSFELEGTSSFKPFISVVTNLTPDHMDWHKTEDNYYKAKFKIAKNQDKNDFCILNYEDNTIKEYAKNLNTNICYFSSERKLEQGIYVDSDDIVFNFNNEYSKIMKIQEIFIPGKHNLENVLAACAVGKFLGINNDIIKEAIKNFKGVEHRLEYVETSNGVKFYNDSKGTNPDASIKAVQGINAPIVLIAGGYDKQLPYDDFILAFDNKVKAMILLGQTKNDIKDCAIKHGFNNIYMVEDMNEAVKKAFELSNSGDTVLLSPACASWGMYPNYEVRGKDFKERVKFYGENTNKK